jgi:hypothetical protein
MRWPLKKIPMRKKYGISLATKHPLSIDAEERSGHVIGREEAHSELRKCTIRLLIK